jgi:hypothetical protein
MGTAASTAPSKARPLIHFFKLWVIVLLRLKLSWRLQHERRFTKRIATGSRQPDKFFETFLAALRLPRFSAGKPT